MAQSVGDCHEGRKMTPLQEWLLLYLQPFLMLLHLLLLLFHLHLRLLLFILFLQAALLHLFDVPGEGPAAGLCGGGPVFGQDGEEGEEPGGEGLGPGPRPPVAALQHLGEGGAPQLAGRDAAQLAGAPAELLAVPAAPDQAVRQVAGPPCGDRF